MQIDDNIKYGMIEAISHLIHRGELHAQPGLCWACQLLQGLLCAWSRCMVK